MHCCSGGDTGNAVRKERTYVDGYAAISMDGDISISERLIGRVQSNMRAEFTAVIEALRAMRLNDDGGRKVIVYSDCKGVVEACNGGIE